MKPERIQIFIRLLLNLLDQLFGGNEPETYEFESYAQATAFVETVGKEAADRKRCPEIIVNYAGLPGEKTQVLVSFSSEPAAPDLEPAEGGDKPEPEGDDG